MRPLVLLLSGAALAACSGPRDPVSGLLAALEEAVEDRDADALGAHLAEGFRGQGGMTRGAALDTARRLLLGYERASVEIYEVVQEPTDEGARVSFWVEFSGRARELGGLSGLLPPGAVYSFELDVVRSEPVWKVAGARWERRDRPEGETPGVSSEAGGGAR